MIKNLSRSTLILNLFVCYNSMFAALEPPEPELHRQALLEIARLQIKDATDHIQNIPELMHTLNRHKKEVKYAAFSYDGTMIVTTSHDKKTITWNAETGKRIKTMKGNARWDQVAFNHDDTKIVTASSARKKASLWNAIDGEIIFILESHGRGINYIEFSHDGRRIITASKDRKAKIWDTFNGSIFFTLRNHADVVTSAKFSPDGKFIVTASHDGTTKVWITLFGQHIHNLAGHTDKVNHAVFSPDGFKIVTVSDDKTAKVWDVSEIWERDYGRRTPVSNIPFSHDLAEHTDKVNHAAFNYDSTKIVTASDDKTVKVWNTADGKLIYNFIRHEAEVTQVEFSPNGKFIVSASNDNTAKVWDVSNGQLIHTLRHTGIVNHAAFSPDGSKIVTVSDDMTAKVWYFTTERKQATLHWLTYDILPNQAEIIRRAYDAKLRGKRLLLKGEGKIRFQKIPANVQSALMDYLDIDISSNESE